MERGVTTLHVYVGLERSPKVLTPNVPQTSRMGLIDGSK